MQRLCLIALILMGYLCGCTQNEDEVQSRAKEIEEYDFGPTPGD